MNSTESTLYNLLPLLVHTKNLNARKTPIILMIFEKYKYGTYQENYSE